MGLLSLIEPDDLIGHHSRISESRRVTLQDNELGLVEDSYVSPDTCPSGHEFGHQIALPYHGFFAYCVGTRRWFMDSNGLMLISPGWDFRDEHPVTDLGHAALLITPPAQILDEICHGSGTRMSAAFEAPARTTTPGLRLLTHVLRESAMIDDQLRKDELLLRLIRQAVNCNISQTGRENRAVRHAKEVLHSSNGERLTLGQIAREVGVSPVYLTQEFSRAEGIPLYRYQRRLRLNRALSELARCDDITGLALDLGFCSHSHFSSAFRSAFGLTPSEYRAAASGGQLARQVPMN